MYVGRVLDPPTGLFQSGSHGVFHRLTDEVAVYKRGMTKALRPALPLLLTIAACIALSAPPAFAQMRGPTIVTFQAPTQIDSSAPPTRTESRPDLFLAGPGTYAPRYGRPGDLPPRPFGFGYTDAFLPSGLLFVVAPNLLDPTTGFLALRVRPAHAQVFVDGAYAGTAADFATGRRIGVGPHAFELRADGYETHTFDRRILADDAVIYRQDLFEARPPAPRPIPPPDTMAVRRPYYVIPGCYGGNAPPTVSRLPAGCDITTLRTREYMVRVPSS